MLFAGRHHVFELVLKTVFETKTKRKFRENWKNIDSSNIEPSLYFVKERVAETDIQVYLIFCKAELGECFLRVTTMNWSNCA